MIERRVSDRTGEVTWRVRWYEPKPDGGRRERSRTFHSRAAAREWDRDRHKAARRGVSASAGRAPLSEVASRWLASLRGTVESRTIQGYVQLYRSRVAPDFAALPVEHITTPMIQQWVSDLAAERAPMTVRHAHRVLSMILRQAVQEGRLTINPAQGVRLPRLQPGRGDRVLSVVEVETLARLVRHQPTVIRVAAYCGLRWGEVAALEARDVDLASRRLRVERAQVEVSGRIEVKGPKSRHGRRRIPIPLRLVDELEDQLLWKEPQDLLFTAPSGTRLHASNWKHWVGW